MQKFYLVDSKFVALNSPPGDHGAVNLEEKYFLIIEKLMSSDLTAKAYSEQYRINKNIFTYR